MKNNLNSKLVFNVINGRKTGSVGFPGFTKKEITLPFLQELKPTPTAQLDRTNDTVYESTTSVVRAVMTLSQSVQQRQFSQYLDNVKKVGLELRHLLAAVDFLVPAFPSASHKQVSAVYFELRIRENFSAIAISFPRMRGRELSANFKFDHLTSGKFCSFRRIALLSPVFLPFYATLRKIAKIAFPKR